MSMTNEPNLMDKEIENHMEVTILNYRILKISFNNNVLFWKKKGGNFISLRKNVGKSERCFIKAPTDW